MIRFVRQWLAWRKMRKLIIAHEREQAWRRGQTLKVARRFPGRW